MWLQIHTEIKINRVSKMVYRTYSRAEFCHLSLSVLYRLQWRQMDVTLYQEIRKIEIAQSNTKRNQHSILLVRYDPIPQKISLM